MGIFNQTRYLNLLYTIKDIVEHFPIEQFPITYEFGTSGADGWTGNVTYQTLILDKMRYDIANKPDFSQTTIIGYYPEGEYTGLVAPNLILPANMYTGPIIPDSFENVPVTVVAFEFTKGTEKFSKQILLIENWTIGVEIGDPRNHPDFSPIDGLPSTLLLTVDKNLILTGDTFTLSVESDIPQTETFAPNAIVRYFRKTGPTTQVLLGNAPFSNRTSSFVVNSSNLAISTATFFATFSGNNRYGFVKSNESNVDIIAGYPLDVKLTLRPNVASTNTLILTTATATISAGFPSTSSVFINNTTTFTVKANSPFSGEVVNPVTLTGNFNNAFYANNFFTDNGYVPTNITSATYNVIGGRSDGVNYLYTATLTKDYTARLNWGPNYPHLIPSGTTTTNLTVTATQNKIQPLEPLQMSVIDFNTREVVNNVYNNTDVEIIARANLGRPMTLPYVQFFARYTPDYNPTDYILPRDPGSPASQTSATMLMPNFIDLQNNQIPVTSTNPIMLGKSFKFPGNADTGNYTVTSITTVTSGVYSGTSILNITPNWTKHPLSNSFKSNDNTLQTIPLYSYTEPLIVEFTGTFFTGWANAPGVGAAPYYWTSQWVNTSTGVVSYLRKGANAEFVYPSKFFTNTTTNLTRGGVVQDYNPVGQAYLEPYDSDNTPNFTGINSGYWKYKIFSGVHPYDPLVTEESLATGLNDWRMPNRGSRQFGQAFGNRFTESTFEYRPNKDILFNKWADNTGTRVAFTGVVDPVTLIPGGISKNAKQNRAIINYPGYADIFFKSQDIDVTITAFGGGILYTYPPGTPEAKLNPIPNFTTTATFERSFKTNIVDIGSLYTYNDLGEVVEKDKIIFNNLPTSVTTGSTFTIDDVDYTVYSKGTNFVQVDPPWYYHLANNYSQFNNTSLVISNPQSNNIQYYTIEEVEDLSYIGLGVPYFTGPYNFNRIKFKSNANIKLGTIFKLSGGPKSNTDNLYSITGLPNNAGYFEMTPAYSITEYTETEQWRRDNETYQNFLDYEKNRKILAFTNPVSTNQAKVLYAAGTNSLRLENIPNNLRVNSTFSVNLPNFSGVYTVTAINPKQEFIAVSPSWSSAQTQYLSQWENLNLSYTLPASTPTIINLGISDTEIVIGNDLYWSLTRNLTDSGTYNIGARINPVLEFGQNAPLRYWTTSTTLFQIQSIPGISAPLELTFEQISTNTSRVCMVSSGANSIDVQNYYVFNNPVGFYVNNVLTTSSNWVRTGNLLEQKACAIVNTNLLSQNFEARWPGSLDFVRTSADQILFLPSTLSFNVAANVLTVTEEVKPFITTALSPTPFAGRSVPIQFVYPLGSIDQGPRRATGIANIGQNYNLTNVLFINTIDPNNFTIPTTVTVEYTKGKLDRLTGNYVDITIPQVLLTETITQNYTINNNYPVIQNNSVFGSLLPFKQLQLQKNDFRNVDLAHHFTSYVKFYSYSESFSSNSLLKIVPINKQWTYNGNNQPVTATVSRTSSVLYGNPSNYTDFDSETYDLTERLEFSNANGNYDSFFYIFIEPESTWDNSIDISNINVALRLYTYQATIFVGGQPVVPAQWILQPAYPISSSPSSPIKSFPGEYLTVTNVYKDNDNRAINLVTFKKGFKSNSGEFRLRTKIELDITFINAGSNKIKFSIAKELLPTINDFNAL